ncbi:hypothetical protein GGI12_001333 [Dipsacomyces acuminosporus]|nr:hypothetical protein GGI12_001333 [Dipsacomyces acuminosporus]
MAAVPFEVLGMIFVFAQWPSVSLVSRRFYAVSKSKAVRAHYYLQEFGKHAVLDGKLGLAGRRPQLISQDLVLMLLNLGADPRADDQWIFRHACAKGWTAVVLKILRMCLYQIPTGGIVDGAIVMRKVLGELQHIQPYSNSASSSSSRDNTIGETPGDSPLENWRGAGHPVQTTVYDRPKGAPLIDVHAEDDEALRIAAGLGHTAVVRALVDSGADVNALNSEALVLAASNRHFETAKHLIASGSSVVAEHSRALRLPLQ